MPAPAGPTLLGAVYELLITTPGITSLVPSTTDGSFNVWFGQLPENYSFPCVVYMHLGEEPEPWSSEPQYVEFGGFKLACMAQTCQAAEALASACKAAFDQKSNGLPALAITGAQVFGCLRTKYEVMPFETRSPETEFVTQAVLTYQTKVGRTLAG